MSDDDQLIFYEILWYLLRYETGESNHGKKRWFENLEFQWYLKVSAGDRQSGICLEWINFGRFTSKEILPNIKPFLPPSYLSNVTIQN